MSALMTLGQVASWLPGCRLVGDPQVALHRVHTDTRTIESGDLFLALRGEHFDANAFLHDAQAKGATALICNPQTDPARYPADMPRIEVANTKAALGQLAAAWRAQFDIPLIAVTGSNGKTTVTQMLAAILEAHCPGGMWLGTRGNFNNDIGVPLTLLRLRTHHRMAVVELGMNHPGEIALLAKMAQPTVALVNNAQREHLEFMHTVQAVARENGAVIEALGAQGVAVFPADDLYTPLWKTLARQRTMRLFTQKPVSQDDPHSLVCVDAHWVHGAWQVHAQAMGVELRYRLAIAGRHNVKNSLAAAACALGAGVSAQAVVQGLEAFTPVKGRSRALALQIKGHACTLVDDTYNANPDSVRAAIDVLAELPGPRLLVLGDMGEVGLEGPAFHAEIGRYAHASGIENLFALGELMRHAVQEFDGAQHFESMESLQLTLGELLPALTSVLVKGSRFMRMERVVEMACAYAQELAEQPHGH